MGGAAYQDLPDLSTGVLVDMGGWPVLREARRLFESGAVKEISWERPFLKAQVEASGQKFALRLSLRSTAFAENSCPCPTGRRGLVCAHALAACLAADKARRDSENGVTTPPPVAPKPEARPEAPASPGRLLSLNADALGKPLSIRLVLPPNLKEAAARDMLTAKLEFIFEGKRIPPEKMFRRAPCRIEKRALTALAFLEKWNHGALASLLQLRRAQLAELVKLLEGTDAFEWSGAPDAPIGWEGPALAGVSEFLAEPEKPAQAPSAKPAPIHVRRGSGVIAPRQSVLATMKPIAHRREPREEAPGGRIEVDGSPHYLAILIPQGHPLRERARGLVEGADFHLEPRSGRWWLRDRHKVLNFLAEHGRELTEVFAPKFSDNYVARMKAVKTARLVAKAGAKGGSYDIQMHIDAGPCPEEEIRRAVASHQFYLLSGEAVWLLPPDVLRKMAEASRELSGEPGRAAAPSVSLTIGAARLVEVDAILATADEVETPAQWKGRIDAMRNFSHLEAPPVPETLFGKLRGYQKIGAAWLWNLWKNDLGGVLADEMGLGKTVQAAALLEGVKARGEDRPLLVVCPAGLVENWMREMARFAPNLRVHRHHGSARVEDFSVLSGGDLLLTSYQTLVRDAELFAPLRYAAIVADEAQHIKNRRTQAAAALRSLNAKARFVLTGTPVENSLDDLRSIFAFILPGYLAKVPEGVRGEDRAWFDKRNLSQAAPYILRREKSVVAPELPEKIEQTVFCEMTPKQAKMYGEYLEEGRRAIFEMEMSGAGDGKLRMEAFTRLLRLRQICADPRILKAELDAADSAKLRALEEIQNEALDGGHRMLVFSQFVEALHKIEESLKEREVPYCYIDGSTLNRQAEVDRFNADASIPVFLISLKAGGTGLNLTGADMVIHYDPWWNPAVEEQATARAHRIGQTRTVTSLRLIAAGSVEEKVLELQKKKAEILAELLDESAAATSRISLADMKDLFA
jgi:superfamily II DNA or RNA helicase